MSAITALSRITGYVRILVLAYALGATTLVSFRGSRVGIADSYNLANVIPNIIFDLLVGGVLYSLFVPLMVEKMAAGDDEEISHVASSMINATGLFTLLLSAAGMVLAEPITRLMTASKSAADAALAIWFFRFFAWQIFFYGLASAFTGILNAYRHFVAPTAAPVINNVVAIATGAAFAFLAPKDFALALGILAVGTTAGVASMALFQLFPLLKIGIKYRLVLDLAHPSIKKLGRLTVPMLAYTTLGQIGLWVANVIAWRYTGGVTGFQYAWQFFQLPYAVFAVSIITAIYPELSEYAASADMRRLKRMISVGIRSIGLVMIPMSVLFALLSKPIIQVALQYGKFDSSATAITSSMLFYLGFGIYFYSILLLMIKVFYAMQDTLTPLKLNAFSVPLNIALNLVLVRYMGVAGLALAQTLTFAASAVAIAYLLRRRVGPLGFGGMAGANAKYLAAGAVLGAVSLASFRIIAGSYWDLSFGVGGIGKLAGALSRAGQLLAAACLGLVAYLAVIFALKVEEVDAIKSFGRRLLSAVKPRSL